MAWNDVQASGTVIDYTEWNAMVEEIQRSGSAIYRFKPSSGIMAHASSLIFSAYNLNSDAKIKLRESDGYGFSIVYSGGSDNDLYFLRHEGSEHGAPFLKVDRGGAGIELLEYTGYTSLSGSLISSTTIQFNTFAGNTNATAAELEELTDGSTTTLHTHTGVGGGGGNSSGATADYIITRDGSNYYAYNGRNGSLISTSDGLDGALKVFNSVNSPHNKIYVRSGQYTITGNLILTDWCWLCGDGYDCTTIVTSGGWVGTEDHSHLRFSDFYISGRHGFVLRGDTVDLSDIVVEHIKVTNISSSRVGEDGGSHGHMAGFEVWPDSDLIVRDVKFLHCIADHCGLHGYYFSTDYYNSAQCHNFILDDCKALHCGFEGMWSTGIDFAEKASAIDFVITNCYVSGSIESGFHTENATYRKNVIISNCISNWNGQKKNLPPAIDALYGAGFIAGSGVTLSNCIARFNTNGILAQYATKIDNNYIEGNPSIDTEWTRKGIDIGSDNNIGGSLTNNTVINISGVMIGVGSGIDGYNVKGNYLFNTDFPTPDGAYGIKVGGNGCTVEGNTLIRVKNPILTYWGERNRIINNYLSGSGIAGGGQIQPGRYGQVIGNYVISSVGVGIRTDYNFVDIRDNKFIKCGNYGIYLFGCTGCTVTNNSVDRTLYDGICVNTGKHHQIVGNKVMDADAYGIQLSNTRTCLVEGNVCHDNGSADQDYGIEEDGADVDWNLIIGNYVSGNVVAGIKKVGANTVVRNNMGYVTENSGWATGIASSGTIAHGCSAKPNFVTVMASGGGHRFLDIAVKVDSTNITVYYPSAGTIDVNWSCMV